jgi:hypothetical protein
MWAPRQEPDPKTKTSHSHLKLLRNWLKFMEMTQFDCLLLRAEWWGWTYTWAHVKNRTLKLKPLVRTLKFLRNLLKFMQMT